MLLLQRAVKARTERLLAGDASPHNLDLLLSDLRFMKGAHPLIQEVAHFAAHRGRKEKGEVKKVATALHTSLIAYLDRQGDSWGAVAAFTDDDLAKAFIATLLNAGILPKHRLTSQKRFKAPLALYAICAMHGTDVELDNGVLARLAIRNEFDGTVSVGAFLPVIRPKSIHVNVSAFLTKIPLDTACEGRLLTDLTGQKPVPDTDATIERTPQQTLRYLE